MMPCFDTQRCAIDLITNRSNAARKQLLDPDHSDKHHERIGRRRRVGLLYLLITVSDDCEGGHKQANRNDDSRQRLGLAMSIRMILIGWAGGNP